MFWIYENWTAEKKAVIHRSSCRFCNSGEGTGRNKLGEANGTWHGPYDSYQAALDVAASLRDREVRSCGHCAPRG